MCVFDLPSRFVTPCAVARKCQKPYDGKGDTQPGICSALTRGGTKFMRKVILTLMALALTALPVLAAEDKDMKETDRLENAGEVMEEILNVPDDIPQDLLDKAECVIVFPSVLKVAFVVGGSYGRGAMICRTGEHFTGPWGSPSMAALEGGSFGFQLGGQATDFVLLVMNPRGAKAILSSKVKLGADMAAAAGPKGRDANASTDATLRAEILSYSRSRGLFAGISLEGSTLRPDNDANERVYGKKISATEIVRRGAVPVPPSGRKMVSILNKRSPKNLSDPDSLK
jgi:lipid-binding SYLF domain-containing protein